MPCTPIRELPLINHCVPCYPFNVFRKMTVDVITPQQAINDPAAIIEILKTKLSSTQFRDYPLTQENNWQEERHSFDYRTGEFFTHNIYVTGKQTFLQGINCGYNIVRATTTYGIIAAVEKLECMVVQPLGFCERKREVINQVPSDFDNIGHLERVITFDNSNDFGIYGEIQEFSQALYSIESYIQFLNQTSIPPPCPAPAP